MSYIIRKRRSKRILGYFRHVKRILRYCMNLRYWYCNLSQSEWTFWTSKDLCLMKSELVGQAETERDGESSFFEHVGGFHRITRRYHVKIIQWLYACLSNILPSHLIVTMNAKVLANTLLVWHPIVFRQWWTII